MVQTDSRDFLHKDIQDRSTVHSRLGQKGQSPRILLCKTQLNIHLTQQELLTPQGSSHQKPGGCVSVSVLGRPKELTVTTGEENAHT